MSGKLIANLFNVVAVIGGIVGIIGGILGIISFCKMRKKEKEPYFVNVFCKAQDIVVEPIRKMIKYASEIQEKLNPLDANKIVQNSVYRIISRAAIEPKIENKRNIINTSSIRPLPMFYNVKEEEFQAIETFLSEYTLKYDRQLQKSVSKICKAGIKIFSAVKSYNFPINKIFVNYNLFEKLEELKRLSNDDLVIRLDKWIPNNLRKSYSEPPDPRFIREIRNNRKELLKLCKMIEKYREQFEERVRFWSTKYSTSPNSG